MAKQVVVGQACRCHLVARHSEAFKKIYRCFVPWRAKPRDITQPTVGIEFTILFIAEFEAPLEIAIGDPERALPWSGQFLGAVDHLDGALLELNGVAPGIDRYIDQLLRKIKIAIVIDADFG